MYTFFIAAPTQNEATLPEGSASQELFSSVPSHLSPPSSSPPESPSILQTAATRSDAGNDRLEVVHVLPPPVLQPLQVVATTVPTGQPTAAPTHNGKKKSKPRKATAEDVYEMQV